MKLTEIKSILENQLIQKQIDFMETYDFEDDMKKRKEKETMNGLNLIDFEARMLEMSTVGSNTVNSMIKVEAAAATVTETTTKVVEEKLKKNGN
jgi:hypothetical protein